VIRGYTIQQTDIPLDTGYQCRRHRLIKAPLVEGADSVSVTVEYVVLAHWLSLENTD
jgi:hypothetical protein